MGIFRPFIGGPDYEEVLASALSEEGIDDAAELSDKILTPANAMTAARPVLGAVAAHMLLTEKVGVTPVVAAMAASDMEGKVARLIDRQFPESGRGVTSIGTEADQIADTLAVLTVAGAALRAPRVAPVSKFAIGLALGQETAKSAWALSAAGRYAMKTGGKKLVIPTHPEGKESMAEKFTAIVLGVATHDFDNRKTRMALSAGSLAFAVAGSLRGEKVRKIYSSQFRQKMDQI